MKFGTKVRSLREKQGMTQRQLAEKAGMATNHLGLIETGRIRCPRLDVAVSLARALDCDINILFAPAKKQGRAA